MKYRSNKFKTVKDLLDTNLESEPRGEFGDYGEIPNLREFYYNNYYSTATTSEQIAIVGKFLKLIKNNSPKLSDYGSITSSDMKVYEDQLKEFRSTNNTVKNLNTVIENYLEDLSEIDDLLSPEYVKIERKIIQKLQKRDGFINTLEIKSDFFENIIDLPQPLQPIEVIEKIKKLPFMTIEIGGTEYKLVNLVPHPIFFFQKEKGKDGLRKNKIPDGYTIGYLKKSGAYARKSSPMKRLSKILSVPFQGKQATAKGGSDINLYSMPTKGELFIYFADPNADRSEFDWNYYGEFPPNETIDDDLENYLFYTSKLTNCAKLDTSDHFIIINKSVPLMKELGKICSKESEDTQEKCQTSFATMIDLSGLEQIEYDKAKLIKSFIYADGICDCIVKCDQPMQDPMTTVQTRTKLEQQDEGIYD